MFKCSFEKKISVTYFFFLSRSVFVNSKVYETSRFPTEKCRFVSDCRRPTINNRRESAAPEVAQEVVVRAYPCPRPSPPPGDAPRTKSDRLRHRRINHNSVRDFPSTDILIPIVLFPTLRLTEKKCRGSRPYIHWGTENNVTLQISVTLHFESQTEKK